MRIPGEPCICTILTVTYLTACHHLSGSKKECDSTDVVYLLSSGETADRNAVKTE
jgi:hypothetical protein